MPPSDPQNSTPANRHSANARYRVVRKIVDKAAPGKQALQRLTAAKSDAAGPSCTGFNPLVTDYGRKVMGTTIYVREHHFPNAYAGVMH